jgi:hypothetical protein
MVAADTVSNKLEPVKRFSALHFDPSLEKCTHGLARK